MPNTNSTQQPHRTLFGLALLLCACAYPSESNTIDSLDADLNAQDMLTMDVGVTEDNLF